MTRTEIDWHALCDMQYGNNGDARVSENGLKYFNGEFGNEPFSIYRNDNGTYSAEGNSTDERFSNEKDLVD